MEEPTWNLQLAELWGRYPPPIRPSKDLIRLIQVFVQLTQLELDDVPKILLLGSTPEFRDLCSMLKIPLTVVDFSRNNFDAQTRLVTSPIYNETFVQQDWRDMRLKEQFNLVLAESSLNVVPKKDISSLLLRIREHMKPGALFVSKTWVVPRRILTLSEIIAEYRAHWSEIDFYSFACGFLWLHFYDWEKDCVSVRQMDTAIRGLFDAGMLTAEEAESVIKLEYPKVDLKIFLPQKNWLFQVSSNLFDVVLVTLSDDPNSHLYPVIVFRAK